MTPEAIDLTIEALSHDLVETRAQYIGTRLLLSLALVEVRSLHQQLRKAKRYHLADVKQIRQLMGIERAYSNQVSR